MKKYNSAVSYAKENKQDVKRGLLELTKERIMANYKSNKGKE